MKSLIAILITCAAILSFNCEDVTKQSEQTVYLNSEHSGCLDEKLNNSTQAGNELISSIEWSYELSTEILTVTHHNVYFNCCIAGLRSSVKIEGTIISLLEEDYFTGDVRCACICPYDLTSYIPNVVPGIYTLNIYVGDRTTVRETVEILAQ